ncbi:MAG: DUF2063 domain-containing protein [Methylotenera sp.]|nr:DUF2063 domain-containing protein [Methylotenera sp.]
MSNSNPSFQQYQLAFTAHIRDPKNQPRPKNVAAKRMDVYKEIVFNNLFESVSACFPVAKKVVGERVWLKLTHGFFREYSSNTPIFRKIPEEFLSYLAQNNGASLTKLPPYLTSLCHYEWVELLVSTMPDSKNHTALSTNLNGDLLAHQPAFAPVMQLLKYDYAVQKISPQFKLKINEDTYLLVFRNVDFSVKFIEINAITHRLIELLLQNNLTSKQALTLIANELNNENTELVIEFGLQILANLQAQGAIVGIYTNPT